MNGEECLRTLREIRDVAFATVDRAGRPRNRIIDVMLVEGERLYFVTARGKDFYRELTASGEVSVAAMTPGYVGLRLQGRAERVTEQKYWVDRVFEENPSMNAVYPGDSRYVLEAFVIAAGEVETLDLSRMPVVHTRAAFGGAALAETGYEVGAGCTGCGACAAACPQGCIAPGSPYHIDETHCLRCGLCAERCPADAVRRRGKE